VSAVTSVVILGAQALAFYLAKTHVERKKKFLSWKREFEVQMIAEGDQDKNMV